jgi:hypothetical protein
MGRFGVNFGKLRFWFRSTLIMPERMFFRCAFLAQNEAINELNGKTLQNDPADMA